MVAILMLLPCKDRDRRMVYLSILGAVVTRGDQPFVTPPDEGPTSNCDDISFGASASVMSLAVPQASGRWSFSHRLAVLGALAQLPSALIKQFGSAGGEDPATSIARIHQSAPRKSGTCLFPNREGRSEDQEGST